MTDQQDDKLLALLDIVIESYIESWDPIWSKFLNSLENINYAPSTIRKYLNTLEKEWLLYQPYNSSGRVPTINWLSQFLDKYISTQEEQQNIEVDDARKDLKYLVESLWHVADWVVVWFLRNDEYFYLWINNLLKENLKDEYESTRNIVKFIEERKIVKTLDKKIIKNNKVYYSFIENEWTTISLLYVKIKMNDYDWILSIIWPARIDYKHNVKVLVKILSSLK